MFWISTARDTSKNEVFGGAQPEFHILKGRDRWGNLAQIHYGRLAHPHLYVEFLSFMLSQRVSSQRERYEIEHENQNTSETLAKLTWVKGDRLYEVNSLSFHTRISKFDSISLLCVAEVPVQSTKSKWESFIWGMDWDRGIFSPMPADGSWSPFLNFLSFGCSVWIWNSFCMQNCYVQFGSSIFATRNNASCVCQVNSASVGISNSNSPSCFPHPSKYSIISILLLK